MNSEFITELINETLNNSITEEEAINLIKAKYKNNKPLENKLTRDLIYYRIAIYINNPQKFNLNIDYLKSIHFYLFNNIENHAGVIREKNISKKEECLHFRSVIYCSHDMILDSITYDFKEEAKHSYRRKSMDEKTVMLSKFISNIWQAHPFCDGNTRTDMVFLRKYLEYLDIYHNPDIFTNNFAYFRNALVRSNYNTIGWIQPTYEYLNKFIYNLLLGNTDALNIAETYVPEEAMVLKHHK